jgi:DNA-binding transcriptional ArsR family regulator
MTDAMSNPYSALERLFHEPSRLAIMSSLGGAVDGLTFSELKQQCDLTDGNLSRHLKTLEEGGAVRVKKRFVGARPQTRVFLTAAGRAGFLAYLKALEEVLQNAATALGTDRGTAGLMRALGGAAEA